MANNLLKNWKILLLIAFLLVSFGAIAFKGLKFGIDFNGGTLFQIHLAKAVDNPDEMARITQTISQRLDWTGLKDTKVTSWGKEYVVVQIAETDPAAIQRIESLIKEQGKFEATLDGNTVFTGNDIIEISRDQSKGYGFSESGTGVEWHLPFTLNNAAALRFTQMTFHRCQLTGYDPKTGSQYQCDNTYFFIDRPTDAVLIYPTELMQSDSDLFKLGNFSENIPQNTQIDEVIKNVNAPIIKISDNNITEAQLSQLKELFKEKVYAIVPSNLDDSLKAKIQSTGLKLKEIPVPKDIPWLWNAGGLRQIIALTEDVTNQKISRVEDAQTFSSLVIRGYAADLTTGKQRLDDLRILLESGSLSVAVESISKETISALLGENFLFNAGLIGLISLIAVAVVLVIRYRVLKLAMPILFTGFSEVVIILGFASLINWNLDLAAVAGILTAVGTGIDNQIVITDELLKGVAKEEGTLITRVKNAFFIIMASASTVFATMIPLILFGFGLGKLVGFAITTIVGVAIGIFITRPAYSEIAKSIIEHK